MVEERFCCLKRKSIDKNKQCHRHAKLEKLSSVDPRRNWSNRVTRNNLTRLRILRINAFIKAVEIFQISSDLADRFDIIQTGHIFARHFRNLLRNNISSNPASRAWMSTSEDWWTLVKRNVACKFCLGKLARDCNWQCLLDVDAKFQYQS